MLTRRAKAWQYLFAGHLGLSPSASSQFTPKIAQNHLKSAFLNSRSFKVIDVDITKKVVASAYYGKQHVCAHLQPFSRQRSQ